MSDIQLPPARDDDPPAIVQMREHIARMEADLAAERQKGADSEKATKENAFLRAKLDVDSPLGQLFFNSYVGELSPEALTAAAAEVGLTPATSTTEPPAPTVDPTQTRQRADLANDSDPPGTLPEGDPVIDGYRDFHAALANGASREDAAGAVVSKLISAANSGDPRFAFDPDAWTKQPEAAAR